MALAFSSVCCGNAFGQEPWDQFLRKPDKNSFVVLQSAISESAQSCGWGSPNNESVAPARKRTMLFRWIADGNESAFRAGLLVRRCLDGGDLEDFHRSTGLYFQAETKSLLEIAKKEGLSASDVKSMLTILPSNTVDDIDAAIRVVRLRIALLSGVRDRTLRQIVKIGLSALEEEEAGLQRIKAETEGTSKKR